MNELSNFSIKVKNFKCFGEPEQGFDQIKPINIIIGRNNSGKSSLLEIIRAVTEKKDKADFPDKQWYKGSHPAIVLETPLADDEIKLAFNPITSGGGLSGNHWSYGKQLLGKFIKWQFSLKGNQFISIRECETLKPSIDSLPSYFEKLAQVKKTPFNGKIFKHIFAERDITQERDNSTLKVDGNGQGSTSIIQNFINKASLPSDFVEDTMLRELNLIFRSDADFNRITCQQLENETWEIYLEEKTKGRIPLSESGSGLKTIILVLVFLYLVPHVEKKKLNEYIFAFEELENNLHPALIRRLLDRLYNIYLEQGCLFFLTTHSSIVIDLFSKSKDAQIVHVIHNGETAECRTAKTYIENRDIIDDLDIRASDLLQANGVIWVEGPSDRIYLNRWIELWSANELKEGTHYQCVFYGGRLLAHLDACEPKEIHDGVSILNVNRNAIILIDSDKRGEDAPLNETKKRIISEIEAIKGIAWVTKGREIENYIPAEAISKLCGQESRSQVGQYEAFFEYLDPILNDKGTCYSQNKPLLAEKISPYFTKQNISQVLDLTERLDSICQRIREWNK